VRAASAAELLTAWELGLHQAPLARALTLLACACPESSDEELWSLTIGQRDAGLLEMRRQLFGPELTLVSCCPACNEPLESSIRLQDVCRTREIVADGPQVLDLEDCRVTFRLPNSLDLARIVNDTSLASPSNELLKRCITDLRRVDGTQLDVDEISQAVSVSIAQHMAQRDPQADVQLDLVCPSCGHRRTALFDIASILWKEVHAWAQRTLRDVHRLALSYGWSESQTLALSPTRRQIYLELCRQ
jgi:hypothetical protein